jgi:microcystin-dependent protein
MDPYIGEIKLLPYSNGRTPTGWLPCEGQSLAIAQYQALFALIGVYYGGDGRTNFKLPDLRGRAAIGAYGSPGAAPYGLGAQGGADLVTLGANNIPSHNHAIQTSSNPGTASSVAGAIYAAVKSPSEASLYAPMSNPPVAIDPSSVVASGASQAHNNMQPYLAMRYFIAVNGVFPPRP